MNAPPGTAGVPPAAAAKGGEVPRPFPRRAILASAALLLATFIVYHPALHGDLLLDDDVHVTRPELRSLAGLARIWTDIGATQQYYPILHTAFWLEHRLWGDAVLGYHLVNVICHSASALLIVAIIRRLGLPGGWLAGFVFALHPVMTESVAWIAEQKNTLSGLLYLGAAWLYLGYMERRTPGRYGAATLCFVAALLTKTATATLPFALLVVLWWRDGAHGMRRDGLRLLPWIVAAVVAGLITIAVERTLITGIDARLALSWTERLLVAGCALWFYAAKLIWPANLSFLYERWSVDAASAGQFVLPATALGVGAFCLWRARRNRGPLAALLVFAGTLLPVLGFVEVEWFVFSFVADHFAYLASLGLVVPLSAASTRFTERLPITGRRVAIAGGGLVVALLGVLTWRHSADFRDRATVYAAAAARAPNSIPAHYLLGVALMDRPGRTSDAMAAFETALRLNPGASQVHHRLGALLLTIEGRRSDALAHLETALQLAPGSNEARRLLAGGWFDEAKSLAAAGRADEAVAAYGKAITWQPDFAEAHFNLGNALLRLPGRREEAMAHFNAALRAKPDFVEAHTNLGAALVTQPGGLEKAIAHFEAALRVNPDYTPARNNLARARQLSQQSSSTVP